jgi:hypothetical protein
MGEQRTFAGLAWDGKKKRTRREQFLGEMNAVIPWAALLALVEPHYPTGKGGRRRAMPLDAMLRIYFLQQWYDLSDPAVEDALYDSESMRRFVGWNWERTRSPMKRPFCISAICWKRIS